MKKWLLIFVILLLCFFSFSQTDSLPTFATNQSNDRYFLSFQSCNRTLEEFQSLVSMKQLQIRTIYPKNVLSLNDERILSELASFLYFDRELFEERYKAVLQKYGLDTDLEKVALHGVLLDKLEISTSRDYLDLILKRDRCITYSKQLQGKYQ